MTICSQETQVDGFPDPQEIGILLSRLRFGSTNGGLDFITQIIGSAFRCQQNNKKHLYTLDISIHGIQMVVFSMCHFGISKNGLCGNESIGIGGIRQRHARHLVPGCAFFRQREARRPKRCQLKQQTNESRLLGKFGQVHLTSEQAWHHNNNNDNNSSKNRNKNKDKKNKDKDNKKKKKKKKMKK